MRAEPAVSTTSARTKFRAQYWAKYGAVLRTQLQNSFAYPLDLLARSMMILLFMWVFVNLWRVTYSAMGSGEIAGLTLANTMWYLLMAEAVMLSKRDLSKDISDQVKDGSVAYLLNKPFNFILYHFAAGLGDSLLVFVTNALLGGALVWWLVGPPPGWLGWAAAMVAALLALLLDFCFSALIGLAAFVAEEVSAFRWIYQKFLLVLGGLLIPLDFFPEWLQNFSRALPFAWIVYGPARLFVDPSAERLADVLLHQLGWLGATGVCVALLYRWVVGQLTINGG